MTRSPERLAKLLRHNRVKRRAAELAGHWAAAGVSVSPVTHDRHWKLLDRLRGDRSWPLDFVEDLACSVRAFLEGCDLVAALGYDIEEEPPLLISAAALLRTSSTLAKIYPDGFVLVRDDTHQALIVDIDDEEGTHAAIFSVSA